jgi:hypothetical protein
VTDVFVVWDAINSVALSHPENHDCRVCKAARGDKEVLAEIFLAVNDREKPK